MAPRAVVMTDVDAEDVLELAAADDEEPIEGLAAGVAIMDKKPPLPVMVVELHEQVVCLLQHPGAVWLAGAGDVLDSAAADRKEGKHVDAAQPESVDGEEGSAGGGDHAAVHDSSPDREGRRCVKRGACG